MHQNLSPSPPFRAAIPQSGAFDPPGAVSCLPNPASWTAGGVAYGACTTDVLRHLSAADIRKGAQDRVAQLASYALDQGRFAQAARTRQATGQEAGQACVDDHER